MQVILVTNKKGGVGKTTITTNLGVGLAKRGYTVVVGDSDGQADTTKLLGLSPEPNFYMFAKWMNQPTGALLSPVSEQVTGKIDGRLYCINGSDDTWGLSASTQTKQMIINLRTRFEQMKRAGVDYFVIDSQPSEDELKNTLMLVCDYVLIPTEAEYLSAIGGIPSTLADLDEARQKTGHGAEVLGIVPNCIVSTTNLHQIFIENLIEKYGDYVWDPIPQRTSIREAQLARKFLETDAPQLDTSKYLSRLVNRVVAETAVSA